MKKIEKKHLIYLCWAIPLIIPLFVKNPYYLDIVIYILLWAGVGAAWNISSGYGGLLSIGHTAYFGLGAYTSTILYMQHGITPWLGMLAGGVVAGIAALVIGLATLRMRGTFYTLATIAFASIAGIMAVAMKDITKGSLGLLIPYKAGFMNMTWGGKFPYVYLMFTFAFGIFLFCKIMEKRKFGSTLMAVRDNEDAALTLGIHTASVKVKATVLSAVLTAFGGTLYAQYILFIEPLSVFNVNLSVQFALVAIIGGISTASGPVVGSIIFVALTTGLRGYLSEINGLSAFLYGLLLVIIVQFLPDGLLPKLAERLSRSSRKAERLAERRN